MPLGPQNRWINNATSAWLHTNKRTNQNSVNTWSDVRRISSSDADCDNCGRLCRVPPLCGNLPHNALSTDMEHAGTIYSAESEYAKWQSCKTLRYSRSWNHKGDATVAGSRCHYVVSLENVLRKLLRWYEIVQFYAINGYYILSVSQSPAVSMLT